MNDIINNTSKQTPIEIALGIDENGYTTARALYDFLDMPKQNFARWAKKNIEENEYFEETVDWWGFFTMKNGNECKDYLPQILRSTFQWKAIRQKERLHASISSKSKIN